jgi:RNA polymerase sigma-70 factor (ECF subfamily)
LTDKFELIIPPQDIACEPGLQQKLADGDRAAFAWLYKNYSKKVYNYAMLLTNEIEKSEDIVQEVFIRLFEKREKIRAVENFNAYLNTVCRNHIMDEFRRDRREIEARKKYVAKVGEIYNAVEEMMDFKETSNVIHETTEELPRCRRKIFEMKQDGMKNEEIEARLGIKPRTVWSQLQCARKFFKKRLHVVGY